MSVMFRLGRRLREHSGLLLVVVVLAIAAAFVFSSLETSEAPEDRSGSVSDYLATGLRATDYNLARHYLSQVPPGTPGRETLEEHVRVLERLERNLSTQSVPVPKTESVQAPGQTRIAGSNWFGSTSREYFKKLVEYEVQKDERAFSEALAAGVLTNTCTIFKDGEIVYITDTMLLSGMAKVRRRGDTQEYWTNVEAVK